MMIISAWSQVIAVREAVRDLKAYFDDTGPQFLMV